MLITEILCRNRRVFGNEIALVEREPAKNTRREITWREFDEKANRLANAMINRGVKKGDKVVILLMNSLEWLPIYFGVLKTGALAVPLNFRFMSNAIKNCTLTAEAGVFIFGEEFIDRLNNIKADLKSVHTFYYAGDENKRPEYAGHINDILYNTTELSAVDPKIPMESQDDAALYFTSGTTGEPKGVLLTHRNLEFSCYAENRHHNQTHDDNFLLIPPLYHTGAKMHWFGSFIVGAKAVILKGVKPKWILEAVSEEKASIVWLLVPWAHDILIAVENNELDLSQYQLDQWRLMHIGAQPVPPSLIRKWKERFPNHDYDTNYGLTEATGPGCVHLGVGNTHKVGAIGVPGFDWECKIVDDKMNPVETGVCGEILVRGPGVMKEYYKNPEETENTLSDGWLKTGDMAKADKDGFIWLVDRKKDVVITGGENIYPVEIENFLLTHPAIHDAAVIGIPDERLGEIPAAVIKVKAGHDLTEEELFTFMEELARYKRPRKIIFADVPRNPTGKIEKPKLRKQYAGKDIDACG